MERIPLNPKKRTERTIPLNPNTRTKHTPPVKYPHGAYHSQLNSFLPGCRLRGQGEGGEQGEAAQAAEWLPDEAPVDREGHLGSARTGNRVRFGWFSSWVGVSSPPVLQHLSE